MNGPFPPVQPDGRPSLDKVKEIVAKALNEKVTGSSGYIAGPDGTDLSGRSRSRRYRLMADLFLHAAVRERAGAQSRAVDSARKRAALQGIR